MMSVRTDTGFHTTLARKSPDVNPVLTILCGVLCKRKCTRHT